jgi:putative FmdB family regulatory protein
MPVYRYICENKHVFETRHGMLERPEVICPQCGKPGRRVFTTLPVVYRTGGFYTTDQRIKKAEEDL